jgi:sugar O-acyltransferase (sialic acid O-acetyltransferase NeuD family)
MKSVVIIGYSGHALVVAEALELSGHKIIGYLDKHKVENNILDLNYLGFEQDNETIEKIKNYQAFPAIGDNRIRCLVTEFMLAKGIYMANAIHPNANVSKSAIIESGTLISQGSCVNPFAKISKGVIINTGAIIEHECQVDEYAHIAPGAVLAGGVKVGKNSFIGANSVIKQGLKIGNNVIIGAGSVVLKDINDNETWFGNPAIKQNLSND